MSFWNTDEGIIPANEKEASIGGGNFEPLPNGVKVRAMIEEVAWVEQTDKGQPTGYWYINIRWTVLEPKIYAERKIFQKIHVLNEDSKKSARHKRILAAIDANAGGNLRQINNTPKTEDLMTALTGKIMVLKLGVWRDIETKEAKGNFVQAVAPVNTDVNLTSYTPPSAINAAPIEPASTVVNRGSSSPAIPKSPEMKGSESPKPFNDNVPF